MNTNPSGAGSLAAEVAAANANTDESIVNFDPTAFATHQTITLSATLTLDHASEPKIPISIVGPAAGVTIAGGGSGSDFSVITVTSDTQQAAIKGDSPSAPVVITGGNLSGGSESGAGIDVFGDLVLQNVAITGNSSAGAGGGVEVSGGPNLLTSNPGAALLASDTTFSGNTAAAAGGAVDMQGSGALLVNCTFSGNSAGTTGGAINNGPNLTFGVLPANLGVINDSISGNTAANDGGGIDNNNGGNMGILSSIVAGNTLGGSGTNPDVDSGGSAGVLAQSSHVLIGNANGLSGSGISDGSNGDVVGHPALLAPLGDYGGASATGTLVTGSGVNQTFALLPGSPALTDPAFVLASLASPATTTDTTLQVQTPVPYLSLNGSTNPYGQGKIIEIGSEQMLVTGVTGSSSTGFTLAVTRGVNGTTAAAHNTNDPLYLPDGRGVFPPSGSIQNIGAFESQGFKVTADAADTPQSATVSTAFANALGVAVTANDPNAPVDGGVVAYTAPASGASAALSSGTATISGGTTSVSATANGTAGSYAVTASAGSGIGAVFNLTNNSGPTLIVTNTSNDATVNGSLPFEVAAANADNGAVTIVFASAPGQTFATAQTITLAGSLDLNDTNPGASITIDGPPAGVTIAGGGSGSNFPVFVVGTVRTMGFPSLVTATLNGLTITNGFVNDSFADGGSGGGIADYGALSVINCAFSGNSATNGGGAIFVFESVFSSSGTLNAQGSTFSGNSGGTSDGGAINAGGYSHGIGTNIGSVNVSGCTFSNNTAADGGGIAGNVHVVGSTFSANVASAGDGGGIEVQIGGAVVNSTFTNNTASGNGGGANGYANGGVELYNSTFNGNTAGAGGGGVSGADVIDSTLTNNTATNGGGYDGAGSVIDSTISGNKTLANGAGGGIYVPGGATSQLVLSSSIVDGNASPTDPDVDANGQAIAGDNSLFGNAGGLAGSGIVNGQNGDIVGQAALLGPLANNGGPTETMAPSAGSPALNAGGGFATLAANVGVADTSITVSADFPIQTGDDAILIGGEQMLVTAGFGTTTLTVTRGVNGTTATAHANGDKIFLATDQRGLPRVVSGSTDIGAFQTQPGAATISATAVAVAAVEAATFAGTVATFTDSNAAENAASDFTASIAWGDGATTAGSVTAAAGGGFSVTGSHLYADEGTEIAVVTITDSNSTVGSATATASIGDVSLTAGSATTISATEGVTFTGALGGFTDANTGASAGDFTAQITWGDGATTAGTVSTVTGTPGAFAVTGSHAYPDEIASESISVVVSDDGGSKTTLSPTASVGDAVLTPAAISFGVVAGSTFTGNVATFVDANSFATKGDFSATIDWGDGSTATQGTVSAVAGGGFAVSGSHLYSSQTTPRSVSVVIDDVGGASAAVTSTAVFADLVATASAVAISPTEGASFSGAVATFTGSSPGGTSADFTARIVWGDGSTAASGTLSGSGGSYTVSGAHAYTEEGTGLPLSIVVTDLLNDHTTIANSSDVADAALSATATAVTATEGTQFSGVVATFSDADPAGAAADYTAAIAWGDGATTPGTVAAAAGGGFQVSGSHVYNEEGPQAVSVLIHDAGGAVATAAATASVGEAATIGSPATLAGTAGAAVSGTVVTFTHGGGGEAASDFTASIDWGDGQSSAGTVTESGGTYSVAGSHTYAASGTLTVKASVSDDGIATVINGAAAIQPAGTPHQLYVIAVYHDVLGRLPDAGGLQHWTQLLDNGAVISSVAEAIAHSDEYYQDFVIRPAYLALLGRAADAGGVTFWTTQMDSGVTDQELEADLVSAGGTKGEFFADAGGTNTLWIDAVYKSLLGRAPDANGETFWNNQLAAGQTLNQVAQGIAGSTENNALLINDDYFHYLGRVADSGGLEFWLTQFAAGQTNEDVIAGFTGSTEYYDDHTT